MGRKSHCTSAELVVIQRLKSSGKFYRDTSKITKCSVGMVQNALKPKICVETRHCKRKTNYREDKLIIREAKKDSFISSNTIKKNLELNVTAQTIRGHLVEANLFSRSPRSVPLLKKRHIKARKEFYKYFAWTNKKWGTVLWTDESKFNIFGSDGKQFVRRPPNKEFDPHYTKKTLKFGGGSIMVWGCFSSSGIGPIYLVTDTMTANIYTNILKEIMLLMLRITCRWSGYFNKITIQNIQLLSQRDGSKIMV